MSEQRVFDSPEADQPAYWSFEEFWERWGTNSGFTGSQLRLLWNDANDLYGDALPYHNFHHAKETLWETMRLADICEANDIAVERKVLIGAALLHDAGYQYDPQPLGFSSKEAHSAAIFEALAPAYGYTEVEISAGKQAIVGTRFGSKPVSLEDKILVRADISNIGGDYRWSFMAKSALLRLERAKLEGGVSRRKFAADSIKVLATYISNDLSLGEFDDAWHTHAVFNLYRFVADAASDEGLKPLRYVQELGSTAVSKVLEKFLTKPD
jgi:hypothetical protein